jgi:hypothetical protein
VGSVVLNDPEAGFRSCDQSAMKPACPHSRISPTIPAVAQTNAPRVK